jgi:hypothetical protein
MMMRDISDYLIKILKKDHWHQNENSVNVIPSCFMKQYLTDWFNEEYIKTQHKQEHRTTLFLYDQVKHTEQGISHLKYLMHEYAPTITNLMMRENSTSWREREIL